MVAILHHTTRSESGRGYSEVREISRRKEDAANSREEWRDGYVDNANVRATCSATPQFLSFGETTPSIAGTRLDVLQARCAWQKSHEWNDCEFSRRARSRPCRLRPTMVSRPLLTRDRNMIHFLDSVTAANRASAQLRNTPPQMVGGIISRLQTWCEDISPLTKSRLMTTCVRGSSMRANEKHPSANSWKSK